MKPTSPVCSDPNCALSGPPDTDDLYRQARQLSYITVVYNIVEGLVSVLAGMVAGSTALLGFGIDSFMESLSGGIMIWRFRQHGKVSAAAEARSERLAVKLVGITFFLLGAYVLYESVEKLYRHQRPNPSLLGMIIAVISLVVMPVLFFFKYRVGKQLGSRSLMADAKQTLTCMLLSAALLLGLGMNYLYGFWPADPAVGMVVVFYLFKEGYTTLREKEIGCC
jgi:cation diffusion facilitator family transporter